MRNSIYIAAKINSTSAGKTQHYKGFPPELTGNVDLRRKMPSSAVLIIEENNDGIFLFRYTAEGACVSDTWHTSVEEAKEQAEFEFDGHISSWKEVPLDIDDEVSFALKIEE